MAKVIIIYLYEKHETPEDVFHKVFHPADHTHLWEECRHEGVGSLGDYPTCSRISSYQFLGHQVCQSCGCDRYTDNWGNIVWKELERRVGLLGITPDQLRTGEIIIFPKRIGEMMRIA